MENMGTRYNGKKLRTLILKKVTTLAGMLPFLLPFVTMPAFAGIGDSKIATGTTNLVNDCMNWLMTLGPAVAALAIIYFLIRKHFADEQDHKRWNQRIGVACVGAVGAIVAGVLVNTITGYYR